MPWWARKARHRAGCQDRERSGRLRLVADSLPVVAIWVPYEDAVVMGVVLRPDAGFVQNDGTGSHGGVEEGSDRGSIGSGEGDVRLAEPFARVENSEPEVRLRRDPIADGDTEVHQAARSQRSEHGIVERGARRQVSALDAKVIEHEHSVSRLRQESLW